MIEHSTWTAEEEAATELGNLMVHNIACLDILRDESEPKNAAASDA